MENSHSIILRNFLLFCISIFTFFSCNIKADNTIYTNRESIRQLSGLAALENLKGNYSLAIKYYQDILKIDKFNDAAYMGLLQIFNNQTNYTNANKIINQWLLLKPNSFYAHKSYADFLYTHNEYNLAIKEYNYCLKSDKLKEVPFNYTDEVYRIHSVLALLYSSIGEKEKAYTEINKALNYSSSDMIIIIYALKFYANIEDLVGVKKIIGLYFSYSKDKNFLNTIPEYNKIKNNPEIIKLVNSY